MEPDITSFKGKQILVAEDEEFSYAFLETILEIKGATVIHAWNGQEAVEHVLKNPNISLVLMDIKMPLLDGIEATIKVKDFRPDLPVIVQTAYTHSKEKALCLDAGCDDYITKPIRKEHLYEVITSVFQNR